jgi:hypothetical protein
MLSKKLKLVIVWKNYPQVSPELNVQLYFKMTQAVLSTKANTVIHCAGYGLSSTSNLPAFHEVTQQINIQGAMSVVNACLNGNVTSLGEKIFLFESNFSRLVIKIGTIFISSDKLS